MNERRSVPEWLSVENTGRALGVGTQLVYRLINRGELVAYRIGRVYRVRRTDIDDYLESVRVQPGDLEHLTPKPYVVDLRDRRAIDAG